MPSWAGEARCGLIKRNLPSGCMYYQGRLTRRLTTARPDNFQHDIWDALSKNQCDTAIHGWNIMARKLDAAREARGIAVISTTIGDIGGDHEL